MPHYAYQPQAAKHFQVDPRTIRTWLGSGLIRGFRISPGKILVDLDEIEEMLRVTPRAKARDGRKVYGPNSKIVDLSNVVLPDVDR